MLLNILSGVLLYIITGSLYCLLPNVFSPYSTDEDKNAHMMIIFTIWLCELWIITYFNLWR